MKGQFGTSTHDFTPNGNIIERTTYSESLVISVSLFIIFDLMEEGLGSCYSTVH